MEYYAPHRAHPTGAAAQARASWSRQEIGSLVKALALEVAAGGITAMVVMIVTPTRRNETQAAAACISIAASRRSAWRWDLLRPATGKVLVLYVPRPVQVLGAGEGTSPW